MASRFRKLNSAIFELVTDYNLVSFETLCITDPESVLRLMKTIDRTNGYVFGGLDGATESVWRVAAGELGWNHDRCAPTCAGGGFGGWCLGVWLKRPLLLGIEWKDGRGCVRCCWEL